MLPPELHSLTGASGLSRDAAESGGGMLAVVLQGPAVNLHLGDSPAPLCCRNLCPWSGLTKGLVLEYSGAGVQGGFPQ